MEILHHENEISCDKNIGSLFLCDNNSYNTELSVDPCQCNRPTNKEAGNITNTSCLQRCHMVHESHHKTNVILKVFNGTLPSELCYSKLVYEQHVNNTFGMNIAQYKNLLGTYIHFGFIICFLTRYQFIFKGFVLGF